MPGFQELLVIGVVALLVFGPDRLPELARTAGKLLARVRAETTRNLDELRGVAEIEEVRAELDSVRRELRGTRADVTRRVREATGEHGSRPTRPDAVPPPTDPEAT